SAKMRSGPLLLPDGRAVAVVARAARGSVECAPVEHLEVATLDRAGRIVGAVPLAARVSADDVTLARGRRGNLAVAWIEVTEAPDGRHGEPRVIGPTDSITTLAAAGSASGRAALAWSAQDGGEERNAPLRVYAALRPAGGATFAPAHLLDRGDAFDDPHGAF